MSRERASIDLDLSPAERRTFLALAAGHALFAVALLTIAPLIQDFGLYAITPLFGLPLLVAGPRDRVAVRALVLLPGFALAHYCAVYLAVSSIKLPFVGGGFADSPFVIGAIGGAVGGAASLLLCTLGGMMRPRMGAQATAGVLVLAAVGALGVWAIFQINGSDGEVAAMLSLYTPWQLVFAYLLAKLLRT